MRLEHKFPFSREHVVVTWCFFNVCNYACSYCSPLYHDGTRPAVDLATAERFIRKLKALHPDKKFFFELTGGEVTLYKELPELLRLLKSGGHAVAVISNGSRALSFWESLTGSLDHVALSFHPETASPDHFLNLLSVLHGRVSVHLFVMAWQSRFDELREFTEKVETRFPGITVSLEPILNANMPYTQKQFFTLSQQRPLPDQSVSLFSKPHAPYRKLMELHHDDGTVTELDPKLERGLSWTGWTCSAGLENLVVDWDGNVFRGWCKVGGKIGNIRDENLVLPEGPVICTKEVCGNSFDISTTKKKAP